MIEFLIWLPWMNNSTISWTEIRTYIFLAPQTKSNFRIPLDVDKQRGLNFLQKNKQRLSNDLPDLKILKGLKITALLTK